MGLRAYLKTSPYRGLVVRIFKVVSRFSTVATFTTLLNLGVTNVLFYCFDVYYVLAMAAGFACQVLPESYINSRWTFRATGITWLSLLLITNSIELVCYGIATTIEYVAFDLLKYNFLVVRVSILPLTGLISITLTTYCVRTLSKRSLA